MSNRVIVGHTDGFSGAGFYCGGGYNNDTYMTTSTQAQKFAALHSSGGPLHSAGGVNLTGGNEVVGAGWAVRISKSGINFNNAKVGMWVALDPTDTYVQGYYEILAIDTSGGDVEWIEIKLLYTSDTTGIVYVGGLFATIDYGITAGLLGGGDEEHIVGGYTYTLSANLDIPAGRLYDGPISLIGIDSDGVYLPVKRNTSDCFLDSTDFPIIDCGSSYHTIMPSACNMRAIKFIGTINDYILDGALSADYISLYGVISHNSGTGTAANSISTGRNPLLTMCDFIADSTSLTGSPVFIEISADGYYPQVINACVFKVKRRIPVAAKSSSSSNIQLNNCIMWGTQSCIGGVLAAYAVLNNCVIYDVPIGLRTYTITANFEWNITDCIFENVGTLFSNTVTGDVRVDAFNNVFNGYTEILDSSKSNLYLANYFNNVENSTNSASEFNDADNGDFTLTSSAEAIGIGVNGNSAGAFQPVSTGGGGDTVVISKGMLGVLG